MLERLLRDARSGLNELRATLRPQPQPAWRRYPLSLIATALVALATGLALMYFLDPRQGRGRRAQTFDRLGGMLRRTARRSGQLRRRFAAGAYGVRQKVRHIGPDANPPTDDVTLKHKVESILFRDRDIPKGDININSEEGVIVLRGTARTPEQVDEIERRVRAIHGVRDVENQVHLANVPARRYKEAVLSQRGGS